MADDLRAVLAQILADVSDAKAQNRLRDLDEIYELLGRVVTRDSQPEARGIEPPAAGWPCPDRSTVPEPHPAISGAQRPELCTDLLSGEVVAGADLLLEDTVFFLRASMTSLGVQEGPALRSEFVIVHRDNLLACQSEMAPEYDFSGAERGKFFRKPEP